MNTKTTEANGKHYATVSAGDRIVYRTPGYVTARMALADAKCWEAFHGGKIMSTFRLAVTPMLGGGKRMLPGEYATKAEAWKAVQETFFSEAVTVLEDGRAVGTFQWFRVGEEPCPWAPGKVHGVRDLKKWGGMTKGWQPTGVQSVGNADKLGPHRFLRAVAK
ncbi:hypothetical protein [Streptomyces rubiginosohelvolus]|uniref:hypothetical protein n=1 Tax=Streptomyces rubiginosohelvolus TaxID=67362 RepID=UPI0033BC4819